MSEAEKPPPRRPRRRSFVLVLAGILVAGLVWVVWNLVHQTEQERLAGDIRGLGGRAPIDRDDPRRPLVGVDLHGADIDDNWLARLADSTEVRWVNLAATPITDEGLKHLSRMTRVEKMNLCGTKLTGPGLRHLEGMTEL